MSPAEIAKRLGAFQKWRRGGKGPQPNPTEVGQVIDAAIRELRKAAKVEKSK